ncbi:MAG: polymer-forming cytoskeletal protein [Methylophilaceae bacterium]
MFFKKENKIDSRIDTLVGTETTISGDIIFSGGLRVDGVIRGDVKEQDGSEGTIILSENGRIEGAVSTTKIVLNGAVIGPVRASQFIELQTKARITGDLYYKSLEMHMGAVIDGKLVHTEDNIATDDVI